MDIGSCLQYFSCSVIMSSLQKAVITVEDTL